MSRKKALKKASQGSSKSPIHKASPCKDGGKSGGVGKGLAAAAPSGGVVYPSRPSVSSSGEFYDIAFKVRRRRATVPPFLFAHSLLT